MAIQSSLSSVFLMSVWLGDCFLVTKLFRLSVYFVRCLPLLLLPKIYPLNIYFSIPSSLFICPKNCSCLFLVVLSRDFLYPTISITFWVDSFSAHDILVILLMHHISTGSSLLSRCFVSGQHSHPCRRMDHV